ncbi:MAG: hypothetical protein U9R39_06820 [Campylobacterota bacterium]|nr:hypothetical protein [Campylobacterota bacterium]
MKKKILGMIILGLLSQNLSADLVSAKATKALTDKQTQVLKTKLLKNKEAKSIIDSFLNVVNDKIQATAKRGNNYQTKIMVGYGTKNQSLLKRMDKFKSSESEMIREMIIDKIKNKGYEVKLKSLYSYIEFTVYWK